MSSPSLTQVLGALVAYGIHTTDTTTFQSAWKKTTQALLLSALPKETKEAAILQLLTSTPPSILKDKLPPVQELDYYITNKLQNSLDTDDTPGWDIAKSAFHSAAVSPDTTMAMLVTLTAGLSLTVEEDRAAKVCRHLGAVAKRDPAVLAGFARSEYGADLLSRLLMLMEAADEEVAAAARAINKAVEQGLASSGTSKEQADRVVAELVDIIGRSVREPEEVELSLHTLAEKARGSIWRAPESERAGLAERLLFDEEQWEEAVGPFLRKVGSEALALVNPLGGCVFLVEEEAEEDLDMLKPVMRDGQGLSIALRMAIFTVEFLKDFPGETFSGISEDAQLNLFFYLTLMIQLTQDNFGIRGTNDLWTGNSAEAEMEVVEFLSDAQRFAENCIKEDNVLVYLAVDKLMETSKKQTTAGLYAARGLEWVISDLAEYQKISDEKVEDWVKSINVRKCTDMFRSTAILTGLAESLNYDKDVSRLWNELASDLAGVPASKARDEGLKKLILLNAVLPKLGEDTACLTPQRSIFLIKNLLAWFEDEEFASDPNLAVITEASKALAKVLSAVKDLYGQHWQSLCDFITNCWQMCVQMSEQDIPVVWATLKLFRTLESLRYENDDIEDAWNNSVAVLYGALINLLRNARHTDEHHLPRDVCNRLIALQTKTMDLKYLDSPSEIYPLLNVRSRPIQEAAFGILHRYIPSVQEKVSIDAAFSKEEIFQLQLPAELLSLVLEPPTINEVEVLSFTRGMPLVLRGYLLTWILIFDHFENSVNFPRAAFM